MHGAMKLNLPAVGKTVGVPVEIYVLKLKGVSIKGHTDTFNDCYLFLNIWTGFWSQQFDCLSSTLC